MVQVYVTRIDEEAGGEVSAALYERVSDYRRKKTDQLKRCPDKLRSLAAGALFRYGLERFYCSGRKTADGKDVFPGAGDAAQAQDFWLKAEKNLCLDTMGKPNMKGISFNLSHAGIYAAAAFGAEPVGIDVEGGRKPSKRIAARFHPEEQSWYQQAGEDMFYRLWTAKESVMKRDGRGIAMGLDSFSVFSEELKGEIYSRPLEDGYWLSVCTAEEWDGKVQRIEIEDLMEMDILDRSPV